VPGSAQGPPLVRECGGGDDVVGVGRHGPFRPAPCPKRLGLDWRGLHEPTSPCLDPSRYCFEIKFGLVCVIRNDRARDRDGARWFGHEALHLWQPRQELARGVIGHLGASLSRRARSTKGPPGSCGAPCGSACEQRAPHGVRLRRLRAPLTGRPHMIRLQSHVRWLHDRFGLRSGWFD
jgi:hypothetical protein